MRRTVGGIEIGTRTELEIDPGAVIGNEDMMQIVDTMSVIDMIPGEIVAVGMTEIGPAVVEAAEGTMMMTADVIVVKVWICGVQSWRSMTWVLARMAEQRCATRFAF